MIPGKGVQTKEDDQVGYVVERVGVSIDGEGLFTICVKQILNSSLTDSDRFGQQQKRRGGTF